MRVSLRLDASCSTARMPVQSARVYEISTSGLRLETLEPLDIGELIDIELTLGVHSRNPPLRLLGQIMRLIPSIGPEFEYGIRIVADNVIKERLRSAVLATSLTTRTHMPDFVSVPRLRVVAIAAQTLGS